MNENEDELLISEVENKKDEKKEVKKDEKKEPVKDTSDKKKKKILPRLFFNPNSRIEVSVNGYHSNETGELSFVMPAGNDDDADDFKELFTKVNYKFWFTRVPYDKLNRYRTRSMIYNTEDQNNTINNLRLREFFLVFHLVDWNLKDEEGNDIKLKFDPNKALSDESLELIYTLPPNLIDTVLATFEKKMTV